MSIENIWDGIIDPLYKDRMPWEELSSKWVVSDWISKIENILDIHDDKLDSFERCIKEEYLENKKET